MTLDQMLLDLPVEDRLKIERRFWELVLEAHNARESNARNEEAQLTNEDREIALERLARELNWVQQKLDPDEDGDWNTYDEQDKTFFRDCVRGLLVHRETVLQALGISPATIS